MRESTPARILRYCGILLVLLWSVFPILLVVQASLKPAAEIFAFPPRVLFVPTLENYARLWVAWPEFFDALWNSLVITLGATLLTLVATLLSGFVYARYRSGAPKAR